MAFEAFPSDAVEAFNDPGLYYVHENGKLRSPPGLGPSSNHGGSLWESGLPKLSPFDLGESYAEGATCFVPRSLFRQTINFVARNLWRVDSLVGFPDIVGKQLFGAAQSLGVFTNKQLRLTSMRLFVEAYSAEILCSLHLKRNSVMLENYLDEILLFSGLKELELGGCNLGEDHQIWPHIGSMTCLQRLGLSKTALSDGVLQKLTTPLRLMGRGPKGLQILDLSGNAKLTDRSVRFLKVFTHLEALDITNCCFSPYGLKELQRDMCLRYLAEDKIDDKASDVFCRSVETVGWASEVVEEWIKESSVSKKSVPQGCPKARKFYASSSSRLGFMDVSVKTPQPVSTTIQTHIRLVKIPPEDRDWVPTSQEKLTHQTSGRKLGLKKEGRHNTDIGSKKLSQELRINRDNVDKNGTSEQCVLQESNSGQQKHTLVKTEEATYCSGSKPGLKVKLKRKRKRHQSDDTSGGNVQCALEDEDKDLLNSYLKIRTDGDVDLKKSGDRSKLMRAMDSLNW